MIFMMELDDIVSGSGLFKLSTALRGKLVIVMPVGKSLTIFTLQFEI